MHTTPKRAVVLAPPKDSVRPAYPGDANAVPVFLGCDDRFFPHAITVIASVMEHASPETRYDLFIVQSGVPRERMDAAAAWMARFPNATLRFVDIEPYLAAVRDTLPVTKEYSVAVFFRIFAPALFAEYDRISYLDSDIVVLGDVAEFHRLDLGGREAGAIRDLATTAHARSEPHIAAFWRMQLRKEPGEDYFFSGGLVMDLAAMRRNRTQEQCLDRIGRIEGTRLPDQDVMNAVMNGRVRMLPCEWNCLDWWCDEEEEAPNYLSLPEEFVREIREARRTAKVVHFAEKKPWTMEYRGKHAALYWEYAAQTPFYRQLLDSLRRDCAPGKILLRRLVLCWQTLNFTLRLALAPGAKKEKYRGRLRNLRWMRAALTRQRELVGNILKRDGND